MQSLTARPALFRPILFTKSQRGETIYGRSCRAASHRKAKRDRRWLIGILAVLLTLAIGTGRAQTAQNGEDAHRGRAFLALPGGARYERREQEGALVLTSPELASPVAANEIVVSWNADAPPETGLTILARAECAGHWTKYYTLGQWSQDGKAFPRASLNGQKDDDGDVRTDTLVLNRPARRVQTRIILTAAEGRARPILKFVGISLADTHAAPTPLAPNRSAWGREIVVPGKPQAGYPDADGWCSPASTAMTLAFWAGKLNRPELDVSVPDAAHAIYDPIYKGTGNWPFNTAFAGAFPGLRAYVTRLSDVRELEDWIAVGIPPIVSVSYDLLRGKVKDEDPGHLMVCDGFTQDGDLILNDPAHHPERGETARRVFTRANFERAWHRSKYTVYLVYPEGAKLPPDPYGHWEPAAPRDR